MRILSKHNLPPKFWGFNFRFLWFSGYLQRNFLKKWKRKGIYRNKSQFRSLRTSIVLCCVKENSFSTIIWSIMNGRFLHEHALKCWLTLFVCMGSRFEAEFEYVALSSVQVELVRPIVACRAVVAGFFWFRIIWAAFLRELVFNFQGKLSYSVCTWRHQILKSH